MIAKLITEIRVRKLFGLYTYTLPALKNASILYGDNGMGKSTLLRLVFHLLSTANDKGHRTALLNTEFELLEVDLSTGITLSAASATEREIRYIQLEIRKEKKLLAVWDYFPKSHQRQNFEEDGYILQYIEDANGIVQPHLTHNPRRRSKIRTSVPHGNEAYLSILSTHAPTMFILNADRRLDSDSVSDPSDEMELRRLIHLDAPKRINELVVKSREIALCQALASAARWIGSKAIIGANQGSMNVHSVYIDVLHHLVRQQRSKIANESMNQTSSLTQKLKDIERQMGKLAEYEFSSALSTEEFQQALSKTRNKKSLAAELLKPYITSLERKLDAVGPIYHITNRFVTTINWFLNDKRLTFKLSKGFSILSSQEKLLEPSQLSSGEQQLLLLFCYVLTARDKPSVFMIDEPEISLNIKWQRHLIESLLQVSDDADIQFIFASHSMELLAQHRNRVVKLTNEK